MENYKFDAFISYRHLEPDSFVAETVHKMLESYTIPRNLQKALGRKKIERVFRDKEELPITDSLNDQIIEALDASEFLIVICSPRLEESKWCRREIETFVEKRGKDKVLLVLADGEPDNAFPKIIYDGSCEPLAADARGNTNRERIKNLKVEKLRLLAQILGVGFDDLKQRHRERRIKTILTAVSAAAIIAFAFAALAVTSAIKISHQADQLAHDKALMMSDDSARLLNDDKRLEALKIAHEALTTSDGVDMPYTPQAMYALVDALRVYDSARYSKAVLEIDTNDTIYAMEFNSNPFEVIYADRSGNVAVWLYSKYSKIFETNDGLRDSESENAVGFAGPETFYYINEDGAVVFMSTDTQKGQIALLDDDEFCSVFINDSHSALAALSKDELYVYDLNDYSVLYSDSIEDDDLEYADCIGWDEANGRILYSVCSTDNSAREELNVADINEDCVIFNAQFAQAEMRDCACCDGVFYVLSGQSDGDLEKSYVCAVDVDNNNARWNSSFNGNAGEVYITSGNSLAVTAGNDLYLYNCADGALKGNYSFNADVGCLTESDGGLYVRNLNGESSVIDTVAGTYSYLGKLIECTDLRKLKSLEITKHNYAYMGIAANGNDNHLIFYNYMVNDYASEYSGDVFEADYNMCKDSEAGDLVRNLGVDAQNTVYSVISDNDGLSVISYKNGTTSVYDEKRKAVVFTESIGETIDKYFGEDIFGNKYFGNDTMGIMISPEHEIIASIDDMIGLSPEKDGILMQSFDEDRQSVVLKYDIYDKDALLDMAVFRMDYYNYR